MKSTLYDTIYKKKEKKKQQQQKAKAQRIR
jgi:hypothetical protein